METIGPSARRLASGPVRRLVWAPEVPRAARRGRFTTYALPIGLVLLAGFGLLAGSYLADSRDLPTTAVALLGVGSVLPVAVSVRRPVWAWRLALLMAFAGVVNPGPDEPWPWNAVQIFAFLIVLGRLAVTQDSAVTALATAASLVPVFLFAPRSNAWGAAVLLVAIAALGDIVSRRRRTRQLLAEQVELSELERARRAVLEERARIAREMHDVVAHHMSMIAVRAETAPYRIGDLPESARGELATIAVAAREAMTDMRRLLGVLRAEETETPRGPQPGLGDVGELAATARAAGVDVTLRLDDMGEVPETVGLAAYRIVQEALANAARHAPDGPVTVDGRVLGDRLQMTVRNRLTRPFDGPGAGHGLLGMRERASLLGGELTAGREETDFVVTATLPFDGGQRAAP